MEAPQILLKDRVLHPLAQIYIGEKGGLWTKHMGLNQGAIGNTPGEPIGNLGNILRT